MNVTNSRPGLPVDTGRVAGSGTVNASVAAAIHAPGVDGQLSLAAAFVSGSRLAADRRRETLRGLEAQVQGGTYVADPALIASEMVAEAGLALALRSMARA